MTYVFLYILNKIGAKNSLPDEMIREISNCLFHNIKVHGKHLKITPETISFNNCIKSIPCLLFPYIGPRIIYSSRMRGMKYVKFVYVLHYKRIRRLIIEFFIQNKKNNMNFLLKDDDFMRHLYMKDLHQTCLQG
jgi:hypothetical protein